MPIKEARKPSQDPVQEKLRATKAAWNKNVSAFIGDLIGAKKLINGAPNKFHMDKSRIVDPIPSDPATILGALADDFQSIVQTGNSIIQQQIEYSKTRRKKQPKQTAPVPQPGAPSLTEQLTAPKAASAQQEIIAYGSTPLSRFYSRLKGPWFGDSPEARTKKYRNALLRAASEMNKEFSQLQSFIVGSSPESIFQAGKVLQHIENQVRYLAETVKAHQMSFSFEEPAGQIDPASVEKSIKDFQQEVANFTMLDQKMVKDLSSLSLNYMTQSDDEKSKSANEIMRLYNTLLNQANSSNGTSGKTFHDAFAQASAKKKASAQIEVVAQYFFSKLLGKVKHHLTPFDKTSALRLDVYNVAEEARKELNGLMNMLETSLNAEEISPVIGRLGRIIEGLKNLMRPLESIIRGKMFDQPFMNMLEKQQIADYDFGLDEKQKQKLQKMIENRQFREIADIYKKKI